MADGIKIRALNLTTTVRRSDVLIVDKLNTITNENITYQISVDDFSKSVISNPDNTLGNLNDVALFNVQQGDYLVYDGNTWVNITPEESTDGEFVGDSILFNTDTEPVIFKVTVGTRTSGNRFVNDTSSTKAFYIGEGDGIREAPSMMLAPGRKYRFDQSHVSNMGYRLNIYTTPSNEGFINAPYNNDQLNDVTTVGTPGQIGAYTELFITQKYESDVFQGVTLVAETRQKLFYNCEGSSGENFMGNSILNIGHIEETDFEFESPVGPFQKYVIDLNEKVNSLEAHLSRLIEIE